MASKTEICNLAISHLGIGKEISDVETERSEEALACKRYYDIARINTLSDQEWSFATKRDTLGLIEESPNDEWVYSYRYPIDCLDLRRIISGYRTDQESTAVPFKISRDAVGKLIYTDMAEAEAEYTEDLKNVTFFTSEFIVALSFRIAFYVAPRLTSGDPFKLKNDMLQQYMMEIGWAKKQNMNEEIPDKRQESSSITARY
jgi:hypothetical protein